VMSGNAIDVLATLDRIAESCAYRAGITAEGLQDSAADWRRVARNYAANLAEVRDAIADLIEACKAFDRWNYEVQSAKVNGESVYSFAELQEMRERAAALASAALARIKEPQSP